jgi:hypothetical protein
MKCFFPQLLRSPYLNPMKNRSKKLSEPVDPASNIAQSGISNAFLENPEKLFLKNPKKMCIFCLLGKKTMGAFSKKQGILLFEEY